MYVVYVTCVGVCAPVYVRVFDVCVCVQGDTPQTPDKAGKSPAKGAGVKGGQDAGVKAKRTLLVSVHTRVCCVCDVCWCVCSCVCTCI